MTSFFPDLNVWLALTDQEHQHREQAWNWLSSVRGDSRLIFARYTQIGFLRLLTNSSVMGADALTLGEAWKHYDQWLADARVEFYPEPASLEAAFREATSTFESKPASHWVGDCFLMANAKEVGAVLVTFDRALATFARKHGCAAIIPS